MCGDAFFFVFFFFYWNIFVVAYADWLLWKSINLLLVVRFANFRSIVKLPIHILVDEAFHYFTSYLSTDIHSPQFIVSCWAGNDGDNIIWSPLCYSILWHFSRNHRASETTQHSKTVPFSPSYMSLTRKCLHNIRNIWKWIQYHTQNDGEVWVSNLSHKIWL